MKKKLIFIIILLIFFPGITFAADFVPAEGLEFYSPRITICPSKYLAGEETLYIEGTAPPGSGITILLEENGEELRQWFVIADREGSWSLLTDELIKSGEYSLVVGSSEEKGGEKDSCKIQVLLSGLAFKSLIIDFKTLTLILGLFLAVIVIFIILSHISSWRLHKLLKKEVIEARETLDRSFDSLIQKIERRIEFFDSQPGYNPKEKEICEDLKKFIEGTKNSLKKEIDDIKGVLK